MKYVRKLTTFSMIRRASLISDFISEPLFVSYKQRRESLRLPSSDLCYFVLLKITLEFQGRQCDFQGRQCCFHYQQCGFHNQQCCFHCQQSGFHDQQCCLHDQQCCFHCQQSGFHDQQCC